VSKTNREKGREFLEKKFSAKISRGKFMYSNVYPLDYWKFQAYKPTDISPEKMQVIKEPSVDISMTEEDFNQLIDYIGYGFSTGLSVEGYYLDIASRLSNERTLRKNHPALEKAYQKYKLLLDMVREGKDIED
jgi:hypothetical protein